MTGGGVDCLRLVGGGVDVGCGPGCGGGVGWLFCGAEVSGGGAVGLGLCCPGGGGGVFVTTALPHFVQKWALSASKLPQYLQYIACVFTRLDIHQYKNQHDANIAIIAHFSKKTYSFSFLYMNFLLVFDEFTMFLNQGTQAVCG